jgi:hypothetical protein
VSTFITTQGGTALRTGIITADLRARARRKVRAEVPDAAEPDLIRQPA